MPGLVSAKRYTEFFLSFHPLLMVPKAIFTHSQLVSFVSRLHQELPHPAAPNLIHRAFEQFVSRDIAAYDRDELRDKRPFPKAPFHQRIVEAIQQRTHISVTGFLETRKISTTFVLSFLFSCLLCASLAWSDLFLTILFPSLCAHPPESLPKLLSHFELFILSINQRDSTRLEPAPCISSFLWLAPFSHKA